MINFPDRKEEKVTSRFLSPKQQVGHVDKVVNDKESKALKKKNPPQQKKTKKQKILFDWDVVQFVDHRTRSPGVKFQCRPSYGIRTAPVSNRMHSYVCTRERSHTLADIPLFGHTKTPHALIGMGSAALAAAIALPR